jgi:hypothetical protein
MTDKPAIGLPPRDRTTEIYATAFMVDHLLISMGSLALDPSLAARMRHDIERQVPLRHGNEVPPPRAGGPVDFFPAPPSDWIKTPALPYPSKR